MTQINLRISDTRPTEELTGADRWIIRMKLYNIHCMTSLSQCLRECRPKNIRLVPPELRRGLIKCVVDTLNEYRGTFVAVMSGRLG